MKYEVRFPGSEEWIPTPPCSTAREAARWGITLASGREPGVLTCHGDLFTSRRRLATPAVEVRAVDK